MSLPDRIFRAVLRVLPAEFRGDYERELASTFQTERRAAAGLSLARLWLATIADVFRTAPAEHIDILKRDLRYAGRMLTRRPALTLTATLTLALGIGANTAIFSIVHGVLLSALPYPHPDRLVMIQEDETDDDPGTTGYFSFDTLRSEQQTLDAMAAMSGWSAVLTDGEEDAERVAGARVTWEFFRTLGVAPAIGRDFDRGEDHPDRRRVVLLSDGLWRRRFGADRHVVGRFVTINDVTYTVAGVMPPFGELITTRTFPDTQIWTLLGYSTELPQACRTCRHIFVIGRTKSGVGVEQAEADLTRVYQSLGSRFPSDYSRPRAVVTPIRDYFLGPVKPVLLILWGAVGLLLLMTCANIANLLLIRASEREEEMAIRRAMGISPARMLRQLMTESTLLAIIGGACGALLAWWGTAAVAQNGPASIPRIAETTVDGRVLLYALAVTVATGLVFGLAPARLLLGRRLNDAGLVPGGQRTTAGAGAWRLRASLIAVNVGVSVVLLIACGLLVRSFSRLLTVEPGFQSSAQLTLQMSLSGKAYSTIPGITAYYDELSSRLRALPGVVAVSGATQLPLSGAIDRSGITIEGRILANPAEAPEADRYAVRPDYFETMQIPLVRGRLLNDGDRAGAPPVAVVGQIMAERLWPGEDPIGRRIRIAGGDDNPMRTIVGVVGDVRHYGLHLPATMQVYMPHAQMYYTEPMISMVVRVRGDREPSAVASAVRDAVRTLDPLQPVMTLQTYDAVLAASMATRRFTLELIALFAAAALLLAVVGMYGALGYVVSQRERELGVRVALGAGSREIVRLVVGQGMRPALTGLALGLAVSFAGSRVVENLLYGVPSRDAVTYVTVFAVVAASALAACAIPARRAASVEPSVTLRSQ